MFLFLESFRSALEAIRANKMRSFLTSLGIIIGVASIIAVISLIQGMKASITSEFEGLGANGITITPMQDDRGLVTGKLTDQDIQYLSRHVEGIEFVAPQLNVYTGNNFEYKNKSSSAELKAVTAVQSKVEDIYTTQGRFITKVDGDNRRRVALIGETVRQDLELPENPIGHFIRSGQEWFKIIGVLEVRGKLLGLIDQDNIVMIPYQTGVNILGAQNEPFIALQIAIQDGVSVPETVRKIKRSLRKLHNLKDDESNDFKVQTSDQILDSFNSIVAVITIVFGGVVSISLLVGGIGIMNIMLVSVTERTREIGICKALGAKRSDILLQFLIEAVVLCLLGGLIGLAIGAGIGALGAQFIPGVDGFVIPVWAVMLALGFSTGIGVIFGILPAAKASRLDPIEALRYE